MADAQALLDVTKSAAGLTADLEKSGTPKISKDKLNSREILHV